MIWFLLVLIIFWKPIYWAALWGYYKYKKDDALTTTYWIEVVSWCEQLWKLIKPGTVSR